MTEEKKPAANPMGTKPVMRLLLTMAIPPMISMFTTSMYNIVDSMYVSAMGEKALTAVSLVFPLQNIILSVAVGVGVGMNSLISRAVGAGRGEEADEVASQAMLAVLLHFFGFVLIGLFLAKPYLAMYTKDAEILGMSTTYGRIVMCASFGTLIYLVLEKIFQAEGIMYVPMGCQLVGAVVNIVLDPIMIFGKFGCPKMGVAGAAIATVIGQIVSLVLIVMLYRRGGSQVKVRLEYMRFNGIIMGNIYKIAIPSTLVMCMPSILVSVLNGILTSASQVGVAAFGLYYKLQTFVYQPSSGLVQALRPIVGYNYGARNYKRMNETVRTGLLVVGVIMTVGTVLFLAVPGFIRSFFPAQGELLTISTACLRIISTGFIISSVGVVLAGVNYLRLMITYPGQEMVALTVAVSMLLTVILAKAVGGVHLIHFCQDFPQFVILLLLKEVQQNLKVPFFHFLLLLSQNSASRNRQTAQNQALCIGMTVLRGD